MANLVQSNKWQVFKCLKTFVFLEPMKSHSARYKYTNKTEKRYRVYNKYIEQVKAG